MEAIQPKPRKSKSKKKRVKSVNTEESSSTCPINHESNSLSISKTTPDNLDDGFEVSHCQPNQGIEISPQRGQPSHAKYNDDEKVLNNISCAQEVKEENIHNGDNDVGFDAIVSPIDSHSILHEIDNNGQSVDSRNGDHLILDTCESSLNDLDINSDRNEELLRKSQLNVFAFSQQIHDNDQEVSTSFNDSEIPTSSLQQESSVENQICNPEVEQLYPSLDDEFYENLQERSLLRNRSVSQQSYHINSKDDVDALSLQNAEAQLDYIAPAQLDDIAIENEFKSFEVITVVDGEACADNISLLSDTLHHLSLQTLMYDDQYEQKLQSCYHSECVSPAQSMPNFEDLNKELLVNEVQCYYHNPQLTMNDEFLKDFINMCQNPTHELHLLLTRYQNARHNFLLHNTVIENGVQRYNKLKDTMWTFTKEKRMETGYCADHMKVSYAENCSKSHCHQENLKDVDDSLNNIFENCSIPLALLQYNWKIAFHHVEQYFVKLTESCPPLYTVSDFITSYIPGVLIPWEHVNHTSHLRVCISILFHFKREKMTDDIFTRDIDRWLNILVSMLLRVATLLDHRFLLNHLLRCPTGFSFWGSNFLQFAWANDTYSTETIIGNPIIDHFFLMYLTMLLPLEGRETMLENYEPPVEDSDPAEWCLLDELGEVDCDDKQLLERDYLELLGQFNFGLFYRELLKYSNPAEFMKNKQNINEQEMMTMFSMCLKCISQIKNAFTHLDFTRYRNFCQRNANIMTTFMRFVSDFYYFYEGYGGKYERWSMTVDANPNKLLIVHNHVIEEGFRCLAETSNVSLWQFLADLPYHRISIQVLWKLYGFLHQVNPEKYLKKSVLREGSPYEIVTRLYKTARFQCRLEALSDEDCTFMVNVFCKMALSREIDDNFVKVIALDIYHIGVTSTVDKQSTDHACKGCLSSIINHCPEVVSTIINNLDKQTLRDLPNNMRIFRGLCLKNWFPSDDDFNLLTTWLQTTSITSITNQLSRIIIKGLNWGSHEDQLFIPCEYHRKIAVVIVAAHSFHLPDKPGYLVHSPVHDFAKHISNSDKNQFVCWCWEVLLSLCLHKTDLCHHNSRVLRISRQERLLRKQKSEGGLKEPETSVQDKFTKQQSQSSSMYSRTDSDDVESSFVGKWGKFPYKMRNESGLASLCEALRTNGEMAAYVALSITTIGHVVIDFQADGIQLILLLQKSTGYHHRALLQVLKSLLTITQKNKCLHLLIQLQDFLPLVQSLARAQYTGAFTGRASTPFSGFIINKLVSAYNASEADGNLCMKFWIQLFLSIQNFHSDPAIITILDKVCRVVFRYHGDEEYLLGELRSYLLKIQEASRRSSSKILSIVSWFSSVGYVTSLSQSLPNPGEVFWWSYCVTKMECALQTTSGFFQTFTEVLLTSPDMTIDVAFRRAIALVDREELASLTIPNMAIYRWGALLHVVPMDHPLLPLAWQEFFRLYFHRITPDTAGVGFRYFQGMFQVRDLRAMKQRLSETSTHFELDDTEEDITEEMMFRSKLSHFFLSLSLWTEETRLHDANLFVPGLPQQYSGNKLLEIIQSSEVPWHDMVDLRKVDEEILADVAEWTRYASRKYTPRQTNKPDETAEFLVKSLYGYVSKNSHDAAPPPQLVIPHSHIPPAPELLQTDHSSLLCEIGPYFAKLKLHAEKFVELTNKLKSLNESYLEEVPNMYFNKNTQRVEMVTCYSRIGPLGRCTGPAMLTINTTQFHENTATIEGVTENRASYEETLQQCREDLDNDVCVTAMFLEKIVSDLYHSAQHNQLFGRKMFYFVVEHLTTAVWTYPPSQQIFAFAIDCLGQFFIRNNPDETVNLFNNIVKKSEFSTILAPLFQPNQGYEQFVEVYTHVINSITHCEPEIGFAVLSKFDIRSWLTTQHGNAENSKQLLDAIYTGFDVYTFSAEDTTFLMFYDTLKLHLKHVLSNRLCALLQYSVEKTLEITASKPHHQQIWAEIIDVLSTDNAQEVLTLNTCHRILYELSKYFLQYKKSILSAVEHDLYSHWSSYSANLVELLRSVCTSYIHKASLLEPTEEQAACVFMITCAVFAPWILVYEEACLPWAEPHSQAANDMLETFTDVLSLMNSQISEVTSLLHRFWWYYMDILGHPIVPADIIMVYYSHFVTLPWDGFVPTLEILHSLLKCVRNNRNNISFVIYVMAQVNWQRVVGELKKESHAFDMLVDVLVTFALNQDIFFKFGQDFIGLFRQFKSLDLSLVSDEGFTSIMSRMDSTVLQNQFIQSVTSTGHLIQFMGVLCRFSQQGVSFVKQITYFKHVVNITAKISNAQYAETLVQSLLYNVEQVFYTSCTQEHIAELCTELLRLFNTTPGDPSTHSLAVRKIESALKDRGSIKEGFSFSQLSLYYLSVLTSTVHNVRMQAVVCEVLIESYFIHCENSYPVLSVSWTTLHERFLISDMTCENFVNHSVLESCPMNIYLYTHHLLIQAKDLDATYSAVAMLIDAASRLSPKPREEQKMLLLWFKIFEILMQLHDNGIRSSAISSIIKQLPATMLKLVEDRDTGGLFNNWFGKKSKYTLEFRLTTRIIATYILHQINKDGSLRLIGSTRHNLTSEAGKAMDNIGSLVNNKAYSAHINTLQRCIEMIIDVSRTFLHLIELLRFLTITFYSDKPYLSSIIYSQRKASP